MTVNDVLASVGEWNALVLGGALLTVWGIKWLVLVARTAWLRQEILDLISVQNLETEMRMDRKLDEAIRPNFEQINKRLDYLAGAKLTALRETQERDQKRAA